MLSLALITTASYLSAVQAHGGVVSYTILGKEYPGFRAYNQVAGQITIQRQWDTFNPIEKVADPTLSCNNAGKSLPAGQQLTAMGIPAGTNVTAKWNKEWQHNTGPVLTYLASCGTGSCDSVDSSKAKWFKIQEAGLLSGTIFQGKWAAGAMMTTYNMSWTTTIPKTVPEGHYLLRFETIALHSNLSQFYAECAQIQILNNGTAVPPTEDQLVMFPGAYKIGDPGVNVDLYGQAAKTATAYVIPGPKIYTGVAPV